MDLMDRRRLMGSMATAGIMDGIFELVTSVHVDQTTNEVIVPLSNLRNGCYIPVMIPLVTAQDGISENTYIFKAGEFVISGNSNTIYSGQSYIFNRLGVSDYWVTNATYVDSTTKDALSIKAGNGQVYFPGDHDLYLIRVKSE